MGQKLIDAKAAPEEEADEDTAEVEEEDDEDKKLRLEEEALEAVGELTAEIKARNKRMKKKRNEQRSKLQRRIDMKIHGQQDVDLAEAAGQQHGLFNLGTMDVDEDGLEGVITGEYAELSDDDETVEIDRTPKTQNDYEAQEEDATDAEYTLYKERRGIKEKRAEAVANQTMPYLMRVGQDEEGEGQPTLGTEDFGSDDEEDEGHVKGNPLLESLEGPDEGAEVKAERFFASSALFNGIEADWDDDRAAPADVEKRQKVASKTKVSCEETAVAEMNAQFENAVGGVSSRASKKRKWEYDEEDEEDDMLHAINREDARKAAEFNEKTKLLPDWFKEDEAKHNKPELPITKWQVQRIKDQWKDVDARPIKKVAEAKQKQKRRKVAVMAKLTKQATSALNNEEETKEKRESILRKLVSKNAGKTKQSKVHTVVTRKGGKSGNPSKKGAKIKIVDKRMKSDSRGAETSLRRAMKANHGRMPKAMINQAKQLKVKKKHQSS